MEAARLQRQWQLEDRDEARTYSRQVLSNLVTDAEAAGFNPLSILRNGGASNYNAAAGFAPLSRAAPVRQAPETVVASGDIGAGVSRIGDFLANFDPLADDKREQESRLIESQIAALNAGGLSGVKHGRGNFASGDFDRTASAKSGNLSAVTGKPVPFKANEAQVTNPWKWFNVNPNAADGSSYEDRYGEVGGAALGLTTLLADVGQNVWDAGKYAYNKGYFRAARTLADPFAGRWSVKTKAKTGNGGGGW